MMTVLGLKNFQIYLLFLEYVLVDVFIFLDDFLFLFHYISNYTNFLIKSRVKIFGILANLNQFFKTKICLNSKIIKITYISEYFLTKK